MSLSFGKSSEPCRPIKIATPRIAVESKKSRENPLADQICGLLYANAEKTGDIKFKIGNKTIKAHKCVLAALSPKYDAQFYGLFDDTSKEEIEVKDVTAAAFSEYLKFYYLPVVQLTHENIEQVLLLSQESLVPGIFAECIAFLSETLSVETVCHTYYLALKHDDEDLMELCERNISSNSAEIFATKGFKSCTRDVIFNILLLDSLNCKETEVFDACIEWAKNACTAKNLNPDSISDLREVLGDLLYRIRFGSMTIKEYTGTCYKPYKNLFSEDERDEIQFAIAQLNNTNEKKFNDEPRDLPYKKWDESTAVECNRIFSESTSANFIFGKCTTSFTINNPILLGGFYCGSLFDSSGTSTVEKSVATNVTIVRMPLNDETVESIMFNRTEQLKFHTKEAASIKLTRPIFIRTDSKYEIRLDFKEGFSVNTYEFRDVVNLTPKTTITFAATKGLVTCLKLNLFDDSFVNYN